MAAITDLLLTSEVSNALLTSEVSNVHDFEVSKLLTSEVSNAGALLTSRSVIDVSNAPYVGYLFRIPTFWLPAASSRGRLRQGIQHAHTALISCTRYS